MGGGARRGVAGRRARVEGGGGDGAWGRVGTAPAGKLNPKL